MKNLLWAFLVLPFFSFAQGEYKTGARIGIGQSVFTDLDQPEGVLHLMGGFSSSYQFNRFFSLNAELIFNSIGGEYRGERESGGVLSSDEPYTGDIRFISVNIPLYPSVAIGNDKIALTLHGGPSVNFNVYGRESRDYDDPNVDDVTRESLSDYETTNFSLVYGAGVRIRTYSKQYVFLEFRMNQTMTEVYRTDQNVNPTSTGANYWSISTGYLF